MRLVCAVDRVFVVESTMGSNGLSLKKSVACESVWVSVDRCDSVRSASSTSSIRLFWPMRGLLKVCEALGERVVSPKEIARLSREEAGFFHVTVLFWDLMDALAGLSARMRRTGESIRGMSSRIVA